jgi:hypothetical protein
METFADTPLVIAVCYTCRFIFVLFREKQRDRTSARFPLEEGGLVKKEGGGKRKGGAGIRCKEAFGGDEDRVRWDARCVDTLCLFEWCVKFDFHRCFLRSNPSLQPVAYNFFYMNAKNLRMPG